MITYHEGDLFEHLDSFVAERTIDVVTIVPHIVNNIGAWGSGFVIPLGKRYPRAREAYLEGMKERPLGFTQFVHVSENVIVANMVAQEGVRPKTMDGNLVPPIRYDALQDCMMAVANKITNKKVQIYCPLFGAGLAGGDWNVIEALIQQFWDYIPVQVYYIRDKLPPGWLPPSERIAKWNEPEITINGTNLTPGQAMAVRVAITSYHSKMADPNALFDDDHGHTMTKLYRQRLGEVLKLIIPPGDDSWLKQITPEKK